MNMMQKTLYKRPFFAPSRGQDMEHVTVARHTVTIDTLAVDVTDVIAGRSAVELFFTIASEQLLSTFSGGWPAKTGCGSLWMFLQYPAANAAAVVAHACGLDAALCTMQCHVFHTKSK
jgi:hypothetical protein